MLSHFVLSSLISMVLSIQGMGVEQAVLALLEDSFCRSYWRITLDSFSWRVSRSSRSLNKNGQ